MSRKVVINKCFGGFGLSAKACARYLELKGRSCYFFIDEPGKKGFTPILLKEAEESLVFHVFDIHNPNDFLCEKPHFKQTQEEKEKDRKFYEDHNFYDRDVERDDPTLVQVVEELGEEASGNFAELSIITLPSDVKWQIEDYDGIEHIAEVHRTWY